MDWDLEPDLGTVFARHEPLPEESWAKLAVQMPWGEDWDAWMTRKPAYNGEGHQLGFDPNVSQEGKGFLLSDGSVWTWPTQKMRPQHMEYSARVQRLPHRPSVVQGTAFHIGPGGEIWQYGPGRNLAPEHRALIQQADPRLTFAEGAAPQDAPADFGHGRNVLDILDRNLGPATAAWEFTAWNLPLPGQPTRPAEVNWTTQPQSLKGDMSPLADVNQWTVNVGDTAGEPDHATHLRDWMMEHFPDAAMRADVGHGGWDGMPENSTQLQLYATPRHILDRILDLYGQHHPHEQTFGVIPEGYESFLHNNPHFDPEPPRHSL